MSRTDGQRQHVHIIGPFNYRCPWCMMGVATEHEILRELERLRKLIVLSGERRMLLRSRRAQREDASSPPGPRPRRRAQGTAGSKGGNR